MRFDIENPVHFDHLTRAIGWSRWKLQPFRQKRMEVLKQFVGAWYSDSGADDKVPVNLLQLASNVYLRQLVSRAPRCLVSTPNPALEALAKDMEAWMNQAAVGMGLAESLRGFVLDAIFSLGVMKVGVAPAGSVEVQGCQQLVGQPFAERVDLDDWVHDITAKRLDQCEFMGNRYRVPLEEARDNPLFDRKARERLSSSTRFAYNERGDLRTSTLSQSTTQWTDEYQDHVELWDVWLPQEKLLVTVPYSESVEGGLSGPPLRTVKWEGPREGPYVLLGFLDVPNNVMPAAPVQSLMDLHLLVNRVYRKLGRQSDRQKTVLGVAGPNTEDGERIMKASDGDVIRNDRPDAAREYRFGGVEQEQMMFGENLRSLFNTMSGNIDAIGGLSPQAHTLGQDELLQKQTGAQVAEMGDRVLQATTKVYRALAYWWYKDPVTTYSASRNVAGVEVPVLIPPGLRGAPFEGLNFELDPYSMQEDTPGTRAGKLMQLLQQFLLPAAPMLQQSGVTIKWPVLLDLLAKYMDLPDLQKVLQAGPPPGMQNPLQMAQGLLQGQGGDDGPPMPDVTSRTHIRKNVPMLTGKGQSQVMQQLLAGGGNKQQRAMVSPMGR